VDRFNEHILVFELITLGVDIEMVIAKGKSGNAWEGTYMCLSIFLESLYFLRSLLRTLCLLIQITFLGILVFLEPCLLPKPVCLPKLLRRFFTLSLGSHVSSVSGVGVHVDLSFHDKTIFVQFSDVFSLGSVGRAYLSWQERPRWSHWGQSRFFSFRT
jgi:hypothetical protein